MSSSSASDLVAAVLGAADTFLRESQHFFRPFGLTAAQYNVLNVLGSRSAGLSQRQLSEVLVVDRSNVTGLLDRMEKNGWVLRSDDPTDRRVYRVTLTTGGRSLWRKVQPRYEARVAQLTRSLSAKQIEEGVRWLQQLEKAAAEPMEDLG